MSLTASPEPKSRAVCDLAAPSAVGRIVEAGDAAPSREPLITGELLGQALAETIAERFRS